MCVLCFLVSPIRYTAFEVLLELENLWGQIAHSISTNLWSWFFQKLLLGTLSHQQPRLDHSCLLLNMETKYFYQIFGWIEFFSFAVIICFYANDYMPVARIFSSAMSTLSQTIAKNSFWYIVISSPFSNAERIFLSNSVSLLKRKCLRAKLTNQ